MCFWISIILIYCEGLIEGEMVVEYINWCLDVFNIIFVECMIVLLVC